MRPTEGGKANHGLYGTAIQARRAGADFRYLCVYRVQWHKNIQHRREGACVSAQPLSRGEVEIGTGNTAYTLNAQGQFPLRTLGIQIIRLLAFRITFLFPYGEICDQQPPLGSAVTLEAL